MALTDDDLEILGPCPEDAISDDGKLVWADDIVAHMTERFGSYAMGRLYPDPEMQKVIITTISLWTLIKQEVQKNPFFFMTTDNDEALSYFLSAIFGWLCKATEVAKIIESDGTVHEFTIPDWMTEAGEKRAERADA